VLRELRPIVDAHARTRSRGESAWVGRERDWIKEERLRVQQFVALCDEFLARRADRPELDELCASHVARARNASQRAFEELDAENRGGVQPSSLAPYAARAWQEPHGALQELLVAYLDRAWRGDPQALDQLAEAAEVSDVAMRAVVEARQTAGDPGAWERAFSHLFAEFDAVLKKSIRGKARAWFDREPSVQDVEEIAQETWIEISKRLPEYNPLWAPFIAFARRRARYKIRHHFAKERPLGPLPPQGPICPGPERTTILRDQFDRLLRVVFGGASPPHQLIAFGFCKLLEWKPAELDDYRSRDPLRDLARELRNGYWSVFVADDPRRRTLVAEVFGPLGKAMAQPFEVAVKDPKTLETYPTLYGRIVGDTILREYYTASPTADISHWWHAVKRRAMSEMLRQEGSSARPDIGES
jgi:hypothetical protein